MKGNAELQDGLHIGPDPQLAKFSYFSPTKHMPQSEWYAFAQKVLDQPPLELCLTKAECTLHVVDITQSAAARLQLVVIKAAGDATKALQLRGSTKLLELDEADSGDTNQ